MLLGDIGVSTRAGADQVPDGVVVAEWPSRNDLPEANLVAVFRYLPGAVEAASIAVLLDNDLADAPYRFAALFESGSLVRSSGFAPEWAKAVLP